MFKYIAAIYNLGFIAAVLDIVNLLMFNKFQ